MSNDTPIVLKFGDLKRLVREMLLDKPKPNYIPVRDFMDRENKEYNEVRYMREETYPELFRKQKGRWVIDIAGWEKIKQTA